MSTGPVVVAMLTHRDPPQLHRLIRRVHEGRNTVALVHHDPRGVPHGLAPGDRTLLVPDPAPAQWGRISLARAILRMCEETRRRVPDFSWMLLVSGQDYPAQPLPAIEDQLAGATADAFVRWLPIPARRADDTDPWQRRCRARYLRRMRVPASHRSVPWPRRTPFHDGLRPYIGDAWVNLNARAVDHVLAQRARLPQVEEYFSWCSVPDEALLTTLLVNGSDQLTIDPDHKRYIRWTHGQPHPHLLGLGDVPAITASGAFFARKFDAARDPAALDRLDELAAVSDPVPSPPPA